MGLIPHSHSGTQDSSICQLSLGFGVHCTLCMKGKRESIENYVEHFYKLNLKAMYSRSLNDARIRGTNPRADKNPHITSWSTAYMDSQLLTEKVDSWTTRVWMAPVHLLMDLSVQTHVVQGSTVNGFCPFSHWLTELQGRLGNVVVLYVQEGKKWGMFH